MDYLLGKSQVKLKMSYENEADNDDDMDFGKSVLFDDDHVGEEEEGGSFGEWNKTSKKKERSIFERKK